jgi:4-hydroxy-tetrahydrodipicolinate synthase
MQTTTMTPTGGPAAAPGARQTRPAAERFGLSCALITPFDAAGAPDLPRLVAHARRVLAQGCSSVTLFGTTGEGASLGFGERAAMIDALQRAGIDFGTQVLGAVAASSVQDAAAQANQLLDAGARGVLLPPPFYFKGVGDDGLAAWFGRVLDACRTPRGIILYHIPSVTAVPLSVGLIGRVRRAHPELIAGVKDSAGDWANTEALLEAHRDLHILVGDERLLARAIRHGGSGAINGFSNFCAPLLLPMIERGEEAPAIGALVDMLLDHPVTPAIKALVAHATGDDAYARVAPPLEALAPAARAGLAARYDALPA